MAETHLCIVLVHVVRAASSALIYQQKPCINYYGHILSCGVRIFRFTDFLLYSKFVNNTCNNATISNLSRYDFKCLPVGPSGLPLFSSTTFELVEQGYHRLAMLAELSVSINSSVTGQLFHYNTSFFNPVLCDLAIDDCTLDLHSYKTKRQFDYELKALNYTVFGASRSASDYVCNSARAVEYSTVIITPVLKMSALHDSCGVIITHHRIGDHKHCHNYYDM